MTELHGKPEVTEVGKPEVSAFKEIKPQSDMTLSEAKSFVDSLFKETDNLFNDKPMLSEDSTWDNQDDVQGELSTKDTVGKLEGMKGETGREKLTDEEREKIKEETGWSDEIIDHISSIEQYNKVYKNAGLHEAEVDGRKCLLKNIDYDYVDPKTGLTNRELMENGRSPIDAKTGEKIGLHHMGQNFDGPFAELCENSEHGDGNHETLHPKSEGSWRKDPDKKSQYNIEKKEHWKARLQEG